MGVFSRFTDIVNANINAALDKAEDPEKIVRLIITEMEETLVEIRTSTAGYLADKKALERKCSKLQAKSDKWGQKAELALTKEREDLARAALIEKQNADAQLVQNQSDIEKLNEILAQLQQDSARLNEKMADAKARQKALYLRQQSVETRLKVREQTHNDDIDNAIMRFERFEGKIDELEAQIEAYDHTATGGGAALLTQEFEKMESESKVDNELEALKAKLAAKTASNDAQKEVSAEGAESSESTESAEGDAKVA
jgi:phage shock protein A